MIVESISLSAFLTGTQVSKQETRSRQHRRRLHAVPGVDRGCQRREHSGADAKVKSARQPRGRVGHPAERSIQGQTHGRSWGPPAADYSDSCHFVCSLESGSAWWRRLHGHHKSPAGAPFHLRVNHLIFLQVGFSLFHVDE